MKFSILIPVYNVEKYLEECLNSVMKQDYSDFEVILVDDGATDRSGEICDRFQQEYPEKVLVIHKENQGLISARRVGIANANGEFCIFVDSDDMIEPTLLSEVAQCMDENEDPDVVMYSFRYLRNGEPAEKYPHNFVNGTMWCGDEKKELYTLLLSGPSIDALWIKAIRTSILKSDPIPYEKYYSRNMSEDTLQSIYPLTVANKVVFINKPLYLYRIIDSSMSHNYSVESIAKKNTNHVYEVLCEYLPKWGLDDEDTRLRLQARWFNEAMYTFCKHYEAAADIKHKKEIVQFNWDSMLPFRVEKNGYCSEAYWNIYKLYKNKRSVYLWLYFQKRRITKKLKNLRALYRIITD